MDAFRLLDRCKAVQSFDVIEHRIWRTGFYLRLRVLLRDGSELHTREFANETERNYSFHWQTAAGELLARWDNAPHHRELPTHPDHKHVPSSVEPTSDVALDDVLACIEHTVTS
jgi:hypothetical protein